LRNNGNSRYRVRMILQLDRLHTPPDGSMAWVPGLAEAFTAVSRGRPRLEDLRTSLAACLAAHSMNVGYRPIAKKGVPALERSRLSHVFQNYVRPETPRRRESSAGRPAGPDLPLAQAWGRGGLVAAVDGMRFVIPVPAAFARPNRKYFGSKCGRTWLNAMNHQGMGRGAKIVSGTVRDSLHMVDVTSASTSSSAWTAVNCPRSSCSTPPPTRIWCSGCWNCSVSPIARPWPTCPTRRAADGLADQTRCRLWPAECRRPRQTARRRPRNCPLADMKTAR
jgi:hypothetical protein